MPHGSTGSHHLALSFSVYIFAPPFRLHPGYQFCPVEICRTRRFSLMDLTVFPLAAIFDVCVHRPLFYFIFVLLFCFFFLCFFRVFFAYSITPVYFLLFCFFCFWTLSPFCVVPELFFFVLFAVFHFFFFFPF